MRTRSLLQLAAVVLAATVVVMSCALDYVLDFNITADPQVGQTVTVHYIITNNGSKEMYNATIRIEVKSEDSGLNVNTQDQWTPATDLVVGAYSLGSVIFTFPAGYTYQNAKVTGAGWDESASDF